MKKLGTIYKIENLVNGKVYVGQTVRQFKERKKQHLSLLRRNIHDNQHLQNAWNKYGEKNFNFSIIEKCEIEDLDKAEIFWISYYKEFVSVYNLESGGNKNKRLSPETRRKKSIATKALNWVGGNHPLAKKVICIDTGKIYPSIVEASQDIGCNYDNIHQVCLGNNVCAKGKDGKYYQFAYYQEGMKYELKPIKNIKEPKKVICVNTGEIFDSTHEASIKTGVSQSKISLVCNRKRLSAGKDEKGNKLVWRFLDDYNEGEINFKEINEKPNFRKAKKVICLTTGEVFDSARQAGRHYNLKAPHNVSLACRGERKHVGKLPDGTPLKWAYYDDYIASK